MKNMQSLALEDINKLKRQADKTDQKLDLILDILKGSTAASAQQMHILASSLSSSSNSAGRGDEWTDAAVHENSKTM